MAGRAPLHIHRLVMHLFLRQVCYIRVAAQANAHWIRLRQSRVLAAMWVVAIRAIPHRPRMRHFRTFYLLCLFVMAHYADRFHVGLRQYHFSILRRGMAQIALFVGEWRVLESYHQLWRGGLVGIVALQAVCRRERLVLVGLL